MSKEGIQMSKEKRRYISRFNIRPLIEERIEYLERQKQAVSQELASMPEGNLLIAPGTEPTNFRYYNRTTPQDKQGVYLNKKQMALKKKLAQKKYYIKLVKSMDIELCQLKKMKNSISEDSIIDTYGKLHSGLKRLITPLNIDDETYIKMWKSLEYKGLRFEESDTTEFYSDLGERMRSKSEVLIANMLTKNDIHYRYECPVVMNSGEVFYPDFTVLQMSRRRVIYWEHLGKMNDSDYVTRNLRKLDIYQKNNIYLGDNLFITYESTNQQLRLSDVQHMMNMVK